MRQGVSDRGRRPMTEEQDARRTYALEHSCVFRTPDPRD